MKSTRIIYLILLIGIFVYAGFWGGIICYAFLYLLLAIPLLCLIYILFVERRMRYYQITGSRKIIKLQTTSYEFKLQNETMFGFAKIKVFFNTDTATLFPLEAQKEYSLPPYSRFVENAELICRYCGGYSVGVDSFAITDFLGLFTLRFPVSQKLSVSVLPRIIPWAYGDLLNADEDEKRQSEQTFSKEEMDTELRNYQPGDPMKSIHFKASAKMQKLMVHKYKNIQRQEILVFPDFIKIYASKEEVYRQQDLILELLLSLTNTGMNAGLSVRIRYCDNGFKESFISKKDDFDTFYEYLSTVTFTEKMGIDSIMNSGPYLALSNKQVFVITSVITRELSLQILTMQSDAKELTLMLTAPYQNEEGNLLIKQLVQRGISVKEVSLND